MGDGFRAPETPYGPGNRGIDYATAPGTAVHAAADGTVAFAGPVGGALHVVVLHPDGLRTTYAFLADTAVRRGDPVHQGQTVGTTGIQPLHFGARRGDAYIDPAALFGLSAPGPLARLLPDDGRGLPPEAEERGAVEALLHSLRRGGAVSARALRWAADQAADLPETALDPDLVRFAALVGSAGFTPATSRVWAGAAVASWALGHGGCTPRGDPTPGPLRERRLAVLVGGLGSAAGHAAILDLPTTDLGYAPADTVQFSYRGGTTRDTSYGPADTQTDLFHAGARLRALLARLAAEHPGVPIDVFAHSQGGLVARAALTAGAPVPQVAHLVTLATPHQGVDLASMADDARRRVPGSNWPGINWPDAAGLDPGRPTPADLRSSSPASVRLTGRRPTSPVRTTSIAARGDLVVPAHRTWLPGAANTVVPAPGLNAHARLPGSRAARREAALAVNDRPPTCESAVDALLDAAAATVIETGEGAAAGVVNGGRPLVP
ncbi:MAG TPA: peptidoglycan DD-metalloendopeptidase family protein [Acidimicrobiales bacterium]|nr:peptidoglycan DD-metalloendopeptidase family protein [Acidimicrobiales bacterium]